MEVTSLGAEAYRCRMAFSCCHSRSSSSASARAATAPLASLTRSASCTTLHPTHLAPCCIRRFFHSGILGSRTLCVEEWPHLPAVGLVPSSGSLTKLQAIVVQRSPGLANLPASCQLCVEERFPAPTVQI